MNCPKCERLTTEPGLCLDCALEQRLTPPIQVNTTAFVRGMERALEVQRRFVRTAGTANPGIR